MTAECIMGVDCAGDGTVSFYSPAAPDRVVIEDFPTVAADVDAAGLAKRILQMRPDIAILEYSNGGAGGFRQGQTYGCALGVLATLGIRTFVVSTTVWRKYFRLTDKNSARDLARHLFSETPEHFDGKKAHGRAEAALLALFGCSCLDNSGRPS